MRYDTTEIHWGGIWFTVNDELLGATRFLFNSEADAYTVIGLLPIIHDRKYDVYPTRSGKIAVSIL